MVDLRHCTNEVGSMSEEGELKNGPDRWSVVPYTNSTAVQWSSLTAVRMPSNTMSSESVQLDGSGCALRETLSRQWRRSTSPLAMGW